MKQVKSILQELLQCHTLARDEAKEIMLRIAKGELNEAQIAAFLTVYMMRHITVDELLGFREAIMELCRSVNLKEYNTIDVCGTGGDGRNTFNISTLSAFALAGAGIKVAKHGNYGVSSVSGSSNMMEFFGYKFSNDAGKLKKEIETAGICFLHAPLFHPALKAVAPVRKQLGIRTFFNMLGPLVNPSSPDAQVTGVFNFELQRIYHFIFQQDKKKYNVIFSTDGYDEISLTSSVKICSVKGETLTHPEEMGFQKIKPESLSGGETVKDAAKIFQRVLDDTCTKPQHDVVVANTAIAIQTATGKSWDESKSLAEDSLKSGKAKKSFQKLIDIQ